MLKHAGDFSRIDERITKWMAKVGIPVLRIGLGMVFLWFGALKFFPGLSPAQDLAIRTIDVLLFGLIPGSTAIIILAAWESLIGLGLIFGMYMRITLLLLFLQMLGAMMPMLLFPSDVFLRIPYVPTLEGQYIIKNIVLIGAGLILGATVRGGAVVADPIVHRNHSKGE